MKSNNTPVIIFILLLFSGAAFFWGMKWCKVGQQSAAADMKVESTRDGVQVHYTNKRSKKARNPQSAPLPPHEDPAPEPKPELKVIKFNKD